MDIRVNQILTNGTIYMLREDSWVSGFIIGALDNGFSVRMPGGVVASKGKLRVIANTNGENKRVTFLVGQQILMERALEGFQWSDVDTSKGGVYYKHKYIGCYTR